MSVRKLNLLSIALLLAAGTAGVSAANLETKSGRYFENYSISGQDGLTVTVLHMDGVAKVPLTDLPDDIARPYIQKAIDQRVAAAMRESDPDKRIRKLEKLVKRLPAAEERVRELIAQARKEKQGTAEERTSQKTPAEKTAQEEHAAEVENTQKSQSRDKQELQERPLPKPLPQSAAADLPEPGSMTPSATPAMSAGSEERKEQEKQLLEIFRQQHVFTPDREQWQTVFQTCRAVEQALLKAKELKNEAIVLQRMDRYPEAIAILRDIISRHPQAANLDDARNMLEDLCQKEQEIPLVEKALQEVRRKPPSPEMIPFLENIIEQFPQAPNIRAAEDIRADCQRILEAVTGVQKIQTSPGIEKYKSTVRILKSAMAQNDDLLDISGLQQLCDSYQKAHEYAKEHICTNCKGRGYVEVAGRYLGSTRDDSFAPAGAYRGHTTHHYEISHRTCDRCQGKGFAQ